MSLSLSKSFALAAMTFLCSIGCSGETSSKYINSISIRSRNKDPIHIYKIEGFRYQLAYGDTTFGGEGVTGTKRQAVPEKIIITWWKGDREHKLSEVVTEEVLCELPINAVTTRPGYGNEAFIIYGEDGKWTFTTKPPPDVVP